MIENWILYKDTVINMNMFLETFPHATKTYISVGKNTLDLLLGIFNIFVLQSSGASSTFINSLQLNRTAYYIVANDCDWYMLWKSGSCCSQVTKA